MALGRDNLLMFGNDYPRDIHDLVMLDAIADFNKGLWGNSQKKKKKIEK